MTRTPLLSNLHSTQLVRTIVDLDVATLSASPEDLAQALGQWITFVDANNLAVQQSETPTPTSHSTKHGEAVAIAKEFAELRCSLESTIIQSARTGAVGSRLSLPVLRKDQTTEEASSYAPYRRYHQAQQQNMELKVRLIRAKMRERVSRVSSGLKQLAELDSALERILGEREASRLAHIPTIAEKRFKQLLTTYQYALPPHLTDSVNLWLRPEGWLTRFHGELQALLLAELDLRLQTTVGLVEACEVQRTQII